MTMYFGDENKPSLDSILSHKNVPGVKWNDRNERELNFHKAIAAGKGSSAQRLNYKLRVAPLHQMVKHGGDINKIAAEKADALQQQKTRFESGNATVLDNVQNARKTPPVTPEQLVTRGKVKNLTKS